MDRINALYLLAVLLAGCLTHPASAEFAIGPPISNGVIADVHPAFQTIARQSSDYREDTGASVARPAEFETFAVPNNTTPSYTRSEADPWWQLDLRVPRRLQSVSVRGCEGFLDNADGGPLPDPDSAEAFPQIHCNTDYDLEGAWVLVSDLPFTGDPWAASVPFDFTALITRFPIVSNGYQQSQIASDIGRTARYVRIQFPPGTTRSLALEKVDIRGDVPLPGQLFQIAETHSALFVETLTLMENLSVYRDNAGFTHDEVERLQERGRQLEDGASKAASIAKRIERLDSNLGAAIRLLGKAEVISNLRTPARAMKKTLEVLRNAVRPLEAPAKQAREKLEKARDSFKELNYQIGEFQLDLVESRFWSAVEETGVGGLYQCQVADPDEPNQLIGQPLTGPLEGYSGLRNDQFEISHINTLTRDLGVVAGAAADEIDRLEDALKRLADFETRLASIETQLNKLLSPLREIDAALGRQVCTGIPGVPCYSVDDVLGLIQAGKDFIGLSKLEDLAFSILDPVINKVLGPIQAVFPDPPTFPELALELPDYSGMLNDITVWNERIAELRNLLKMPSIFQCAEADGVVEETPTTGEE